MKPRWLLLASVCIGCEGETVVAARTDAASDAPGGCMLAGNLVTNGDFASGASAWAPYNAKTESIAGPCGGRALRVYDATVYGSIGQTIVRTLPPGARVKVRAYFRGLPATITPPGLLVRFQHATDSGEVSTQEMGAVAQSGAEWLPVEADAVLKGPESSMSVIISARVPELDEFAVAAVSIVVE